jgi:hypothetical protein
VNSWGLPPRQIKHYFDGFQAAGVRLGIGQPDQSIVHSDIGGTRTQLPQHGIHAGLGDLKAVLLEPAPYQGVELPPPDAVQLFQRIQDESLLYGQKHGRHLPSSGAPM